MAGLWLGADPILLASTSAVRRYLLEAAGFPVETEPSGVDERGIEATLGSPAPPELALRLAREKAGAVTRRHPDRVVIGADQVLDLDGVPVSKPTSPAEARRQLARLVGRSHVLHSAVAVSIPGRPPAVFVEAARLTMRALGEDDIADYVEVAGASATRSPGGYELEHFGIHLFSRFEGEHSTILGLPMLPLLAILRENGLLRF